MLIRDALPAEMNDVGDIRLAAYRAGGFISEDSGYAPTLRALGADGSGHVLVAVNGADGLTGRGESIIGTVMLQTWPQAGEVVTGPHEAEIRALAVRPEAQGHGVGRELLRQAPASPVMTAQPPSAPDTPARADSSAWISARRPTRTGHRTSPTIPVCRIGARPVSNGVTASPRIRLPRWKACPG